MNEIDRLALLAELTGEHCGLNHGPETRPEEHPACNYLVVPFGYQKSSLEDVAVREMVIPVCHECAVALSRDEWTLLYCFECSNSRWVHRELARNNYRHHILWLRGCPDCTKKFGGLYFDEVSPVEQEVKFVADHAALLAA